MATTTITAVDLHILVQLRGVLLGGGEPSAAAMYYHTDWLVVAVAGST